MIACRHCWKPLRAVGMVYIDTTNRRASCAGDGDRLHEPDVTGCVPTRRCVNVWTVGPAFSQDRPNPAGQLRLSGRSQT